jgi:Polysaccharide lyase/Bacterial Ig domain
MHRLPLLVAIGAVIALGLAPSAMATTLEWKAPTKRAYASGASVPLEVRATGSRRVARVRFYLDGRRVGTDRRAPFRDRIDSAKLRRGSHRLRAVARLRGGKTVSSRMRLRVRRPGRDGGGGGNHGGGDGRNDGDDRGGGGRGGKPKPKPPPPPPPPPPAPEPPAGSLPIPSGSRLLWSALFNSGKVDSGWGVQAPTGGLQVQSSIVAEGSHALFVQRRDGDPLVASGSRSEISGRYTSNSDTAEYLYTGRFLIPRDSAMPGSSWQFVFQWHDTTGGSPPLAMFVTGRNGDPAFGLKLGAGAGGRTDWTRSGVAFDAWHAFALRIRWSRSSTQGFMELWFDGQWQNVGPVGPNGVPRKTYATNPASDAVYLKAGVYRSKSHPAGTTTRYLDDIRVYQIGS